MATTTVSDAVVVPQAQGTGLGSEDDNVDAATAVLLARHLGGEYVDTSYGGGLSLTRDDANDEIDVGPGICFIEDDSTSTGGSRGSGGNPQVQSTSSSGYDTEIPANQHYLVIFPTTTSVSVTDATSSTIWINITDVTSNNAIELRSDSGGGTTATPGDTFIELVNGIADDGSGSPTRPNDLNPSDRAALDGSQGTDGQVWTSTGSAAQWEAGGAMVPLRSITASGSSVEFANGNIDSTYRVYLLIITNLRSTTDGNNFQITYSSDNGSTYKTADGSYKWALDQASDGGTAAAAGSPPDEYIRLSSSGNETGENANWQLWLSDPSDSNFNTHIGGTGSRHYPGSGVESSRMFGAETSAAAVDAIKIAEEGGNNYDSGTFDLYGVAKP